LLGLRGLRICWGLDSNLPGRGKTNALDAGIGGFAADVGQRRTQCTPCFRNVRGGMLQEQGAVVARFARWHRAGRLYSWGRDCHGNERYGRQLLLGVVSMSPLAVLGAAVLGVVIGVVSGLVGIGGGALLIPALVLFYGMSQIRAQGTRSACSRSGSTTRQGTWT
jgi:hypothetical protein